MQLDQIQLVERELRSYVLRTPLVRCDALEKEIGFSGRIFVKCENLQKTQSFKIRGAFHALLQLSSKEKERGVIARSSGNFAQALAYAGQTLKVPVTVVMPSNAPEIKKRGALQYKGRVVLTDPSYDAQNTKVKELALAENLIVLHPFNHPHVIEGAMTIGLEIWEDLPEVAHYFCQIGGGGLMSGSATALKKCNPDIRVVGVEPIGANDYFLSHQKGSRVRLEHVNTIADGLRAPEVGDLNWPLLQKAVDLPVTVTDEEIVAAMDFLYKKMGMIVEPSGAVSFAALRRHLKNKEGDVVALLSGANVDRP